MPEKTTQIALHRRYLHKAGHATDGRWFTFAVLGALVVITAACMGVGTWATAHLLGIQW